MSELVFGATPPIGPAGGDLAGTYPSPTVADLTITGEARGQVLVRGAAAWGGQAVGSAGDVFTSGGAGADNSWGAPVLPTGYVSGLEVAWSTVARVTIAAGKCRDSTDVYNIVNAAPLTVDITVAGANGLDTGAEAVSTWYAIYVIAGAAVATAGLLVAGVAAPTLPAGYTVFRRVGWVRNTAAGNFRAFQAFGSGSRISVNYTDVYTDRILLNGGAQQALTAVDASGYAPPTSRLMQLRVRGNSAPTIYLSENGTANAHNLSGTDDSRIVLGTTAAQAIYYGHSAAGGTLTIHADGYEDTL